jgi:hypothetical protein
VSLSVLVGVVVAVRRAVVVAAVLWRAIAHSSTRARTRRGSGLVPLPRLLAAAHYMRNTPNPPRSTGALSAADSDSPSTVRLAAGSMMPSSHSRAVE